MPLTTFLTPLDILVKMESFFFFLDEDGDVFDGTSSGTSFEGSYTANTSEDDLINSTLTQQKEDSDSYSEIMNADVKDQKTADDIYNELFVENKPIRVILSGTDDSTPLNVLVQNSGFDQLLQQIFMSASNINY